MAFVTKQVSDLSGEDANQDEFVTLTVREHPALQNGPVQLDVLPSEIAGLQEAGEIVVLEVRTNGDTKQLVVPLDDFNGLATDMTKVGGKLDSESSLSNRVFRDLMRLRKGAGLTMDKVFQCEAP